MYLYIYPYTQATCTYPVVKATVDLLHKDGITRKIAEQVIIYNDEIQANPKIAQYEKQLQDVEKALSNFTRAIEQGIFNDKTQERMLQLQSEKADLLWRIDGEKLDIPIKLDLDETIFWFEQFANGETQDRAYCERLIDTFVNKVILWNDKMIIVYNIKGADNDKITVEQILSEYENELNQQRFNSQQCGDPGGTRTRDTAVKGQCLNRLTTGPHVSEKLRVKS